MASVGRITGTVIAPSISQSASDAPRASAAQVDTFEAGTPATDSNFIAPDPNTLDWRGINITNSQRFPWISQTRPFGGDPNYQGGANCAPACMAMVCRYFGLGGSQSDEQLIDQLASTGNTDATRGTSPLGILHMAHSLGLKCAARGPVVGTAWSTQWIDSYLAKGQPLIACGNGAAMPGREGQAPFGHYIAIIAKNSVGDYLVRDPLDNSERFLTAGQLKQFVNTNPYGDGNVFAVGRWDQAPPLI